MDQRAKRPLFALVALALILWCAFLGYDWFMRRSSESVVGSIGQGESPTPQTQEATPQPVLLADYDTTVYIAGGEPVRLTELAAGRPLVINFWASWCGPCVEEMPDFLDIYSDYKDRVSFAFVDAVDGDVSIAEADEVWLVKHELSSLPVYYDLDDEVISRFGLQVYPTTVIVSADGEILTVSPGRIDPVLFRGALNTLVGPSSQSS